MTEKIPTGESDQDRALTKSEGVRPPDFIKNLQQRLGPDVDREIKRDGTYTHFIISTDAFDYSASEQDDKAMALIREVRGAVNEKMPDVGFAASYGFKNPMSKEAKRGFRMPFSLSNLPSEDLQELQGTKKEIGNQGQI